MDTLDLHSSQNPDNNPDQGETYPDRPYENEHDELPSPEEGSIDSLDLNAYLIKQPAATYYARVKGNSMNDAGITDGDLLIVDKSIEPTEGKIAICHIDGEFTVKRIQIQDKEIWLMPANEAFQPIKLTENNNMVIWGIVTFVIKKL